MTKGRSPGRLRASVLTQALAGSVGLRLRVVGFFPAGRPQVAISVIVDDADHKVAGGTAYGGRVAAPSFKRIGERLIPILPSQSANPPPPPSALVAAHEGIRR